MSGWNCFPQAFLLVAALCEHSPGLFEYFFLSEFFMVKRVGVEDNIVVVGSKEEFS